MDLHHIKTVWKSKMAFDSQIDGHILRMDTGGELGDDTGPSPKKILLSSLAGCTGMDVASILKKMKVNVESFSVEVEGDVTEEHPKRFEGMKVIYRLKGKRILKGI